MTSQTAPNPTFARFSRGGFGFSSRNDTKKKAGDDEDWYIPYNGPYELPRDTPRREKARDSWGDVLEDFDDGVLGDKELQMRYGGDFNSRTSSSGRYVEEERKGRSRDRTFSVTSGRTTSSGAMDPGRGSLTLNRRSTVSASNPPPLPSYANIDAIAGGVGESPVPHVKHSKDAHRISLASIFSLGGLNRKSATSPFSELKANRSRTKSLLPEKEKTYGKLDSFGRSSISSDYNSKSGPNENQYRRPHDQQQPQVDKLDSIVTDDEDYYNSYYETLIPPPSHDQSKLTPGTYQSRSPTTSSDSRGSSQPHKEYGNVSRQNSTSTSSGHPYAYAFPSTEISPAPQSAPLTLTPHPAFNPVLSVPPRLTFTTPGAGPSSAGGLNSQSAFPTIASGFKAVKTSTSTPNLRNRISSSSHSSPMGPNISNLRPNPINTTIAAPTFVFPKGKERWLSAETWCDALLFPRPRLRLKQEILPSQPVSQPTTSGRIVSPPVTPTEQEFEMQQKEREPGIASRVLAHSRSLVDLGLGKGKKKEEDDPPKKSILIDAPNAESTGRGLLRPPRPKSFAMDDLALPSPVPSLAHVLREGALLDSERKAWQRQAQNSFGNKRSRTVSRTRSKSLTQRSRQQMHQHQSSIEYIAAQACLGTQNYSPTIAPPRLAYFSDGTSPVTSKGSHSHGSHSNSNSLVKSLTKSSKSHSRTHSRNDSWSKSALKAPVSKPLQNSGLLSSDPFSMTVTPAQQKVADLEGALKGQGTRFIPLADPAHLPLDRGLPTYPSTSTNTNLAASRKTPSPVFSTISDSKVGIALGTPPEEDSDAGVNYLPSHPYARGGLSISNTGNGVEHWHPDFAGPHATVPAPAASKAPPISEILTRHKQPPPPIVLHPYAQPPSNRDSYLDANGLIGKYRSEDAAAHASKMWAQLSPSDGVVQEVLSADLKYSPFSPETASRHTLGIHDIVGVGETLVNATRYRRASPDSGLGTSESHGNNSSQSQHQQRVGLQSGRSKPLDPAEFGSRDEPEEDFDSSRYVDQHETQNTSGLSSLALNRNMPAYNYDYLSLPPQDRHSRNPSPASAMTSESSSPQHSPRPLGSPHDLEGFQDLFFRPNMYSSQRTPNEAALPESPAAPHTASTPWENSMRTTHRTDSTLTNLAQQLSDEFEQMAQERERERESSQYSQSVISSLRQHSGLLRRPTEGSLQFVFEEMQRSASPVEDNIADPIHAFKPSETLPEDIISSRASSFIENSAENDPTAVFRVGMVESISTPPAVSTEHRLSYIGQTAYMPDKQDQKRRGLSSPASPDSHARVLSGLQPPSTDATRSSYMTTSTLSRMSNLSDFPVPPKDNNRLVPKHMSLLSSYFDESLPHNEEHTEILPTAPSTLLKEDRVTFGGNQSANDLVETLSSPRPEPF